jgi:hypothetical protein
MNGEEMNIGRVFATAVATVLATGAIAGLVVVYGRAGTFGASDGAEGRPNDVAAVAPCEALAADVGNSSEVLGAFEGTLAGVQALLPSQHPSLHPALEREHRVVVCFLSTRIEKGAPGVNALFDRGMYLVVEGVPELLAAGDRTNLVVRAPSD